NTSTSLELLASARRLLPCRLSNRTLWLSASGAYRLHPSLEQLVGAIVIDCSVAHDEAREGRATIRISVSVAAAAFNASRSPVSPNILSGLKRDQNSPIARFKRSGLPQSEARPLAALEWLTRSLANGSDGAQAQQQCLDARPSSLRSTCDV